MFLYMLKHIKTSTKSPLPLLSMLCCIWKAKEQETDRKWWVMVAGGDGGGGGGGGAFLRILLCLFFGGRSLCMSFLVSH